MPIPYVTLTCLQGRIPGPFLSEALDDGPGSSPSEVWNSIANDVQTEIDGALGTRYATPFNNPLPAVVVQAAKVLASNAVYTRRGKEENPFSKEAAKVREQLAAIGAGNQPLQPKPGAGAASAQPSAILAPAGATSSVNKISL